MPAELLRAVGQSCGCAIWSRPESINGQVRTSCTCRSKHLGDAIVIRRDSRPGRTGEKSGPCCRNRCSRGSGHPAEQNSAPVSLPDSLRHAPLTAAMDVQLPERTLAVPWRWVWGCHGQPRGVSSMPRNLCLSVSSCPSRDPGCCPPGPLSEDAQLRENAVSLWRPAAHAFQAGF